MRNLFGMCSKNTALFVSNGVIIVTDSWEYQSFRENLKCFLRTWLFFDHEKQAFKTYEIKL